jgi:type IV secretory pathway VirJ component
MKPVRALCPLVVAIVMLAASPAAKVDDLPLIEMLPTGPPTDKVAIIVSGDGGWSFLEGRMGRALNARGVPVVGLNSLRYFWKRRTPEEASQALEQILQRSLERWPGRKFILIGYSAGADVVPFMASRLPKESLDQVALIALLGPEPTVDFQFHLTDWIWSTDRKTALRVLPEVEKLRGKKILCVYGKEEKNSLCRRLDPGLALLDERPGSHHFDRRYHALARRVLREAG